MIDCVLDASVAAKWFLPPAGEPHAYEALRMLSAYGTGRVNFYVPDLFWPEMTNILVKAVRDDRISPATAEKALDGMRGLRFEVTVGRELLNEALAIATGCRTSGYDALYVALAVLRNCTMITADRKLVNAIGGRFPVYSLADPEMALRFL